MADARAPDPAASRPPNRAEGRCRSVFHAYIERAENRNRALCFQSGGKDLARKGVTVNIEDIYDFQGNSAGVCGSTSSEARGVCIGCNRLTRRADLVSKSAK